MKSSDKIFLERDHSLGYVLGRLAGLEGKEVVFSVPEGSALGLSADNFRLLKERCDGLGKVALVESVDDYILGLAGSAGIGVVSPVFKAGGRQVYDILPVGSKKVVSKETDPIDASHGAGARDNERGVEKVGVEDDVDETLSKVDRFWEHGGDREVRGGEERSGGLPAGGEGGESGEEQEEEEVAQDEVVYTPKKAFGRFVLSGKSGRFAGGAGRVGRVMIKLGILVVVVGGSVWVAAGVLPRASIRLVLKDYPVEFSEIVEADVDVSEVGEVGGKIVIPGEVLESMKNIELSFPARGKEEVQRKAGGSLVIYNAHSSDSQILVARTRFEAPDGKIFRIEEKVLVPGAKVVGGRIEPSTVEVEVVADKAGEEYNIGPVAKWTIPGFEGGSRYDGFYAKSEGSMSGGYIGFQSVPTDEDVARAKEMVRDSLLESLRGEVAVLLTDNYRVLDDTTYFGVKKEEIFLPDPGEDDFSIFAEAELKQIVFDGTVLEDEILERARRELAQGVDFNVSELNFDYKDVKVILDNGEVSFEVSGTVVFEAEVDSGGLVAQLLGKKSEVVKEIVFGLPGLERAHVSLWPFWVSKVPDDPEKVEMVLE